MINVSDYDKSLHRHDKNRRWSHGKQRLKRCVFWWLRKTGSEGADVTCGGRPLQIRAAATEVYCDNTRLWMTTHLFLRHTGWLLLLLLLRWWWWWRWMSDSGWSTHSTSTTGTSTLRLLPSTTTRHLLLLYTTYTHTHIHTHIHTHTFTLLHICLQEFREGSGVVRIDPLRFLVGCRKSRLNQVLSVLSLSLVFWVCVLCCSLGPLFVLFWLICVFCLLVVLVRLSVPVQVIDWKDSSQKWPITSWWGR